MGFFVRSVMISKQKAGTKGDYFNFSFRFTSPKTNGKTEKCEDIAIKKAEKRAMTMIMMVVIIIMSLIEKVYVEYFIIFYLVARSLFFCLCLHR